MKHLLRIFVAALVCAPWLAFGAGYQFIQGYNVLDEGNSPGISTNLGATAGFERDIAVDADRGIIYIARGSSVNQDGREPGTVGIAAIVVTNGFNGSNYRDTGLVIQDVLGSAQALQFVQALHYDKASDKLYVLGAGSGSAPIIFTAPGGTLGGAPEGGNPAYLNPILQDQFQINPIPDFIDSTVTRGGTGRGMTVRTVGDVTTVYIAMGNHVQAWSNDQSTSATNSAWRRVWATLRPPATTTVATRVNSSTLNGIAVDDLGNTYFNVGGSTPARLWCVPVDITNQVANPFYVDFADRALGGTNAGPNVAAIPIIIRASSDVSAIANPQDLTYFRDGTRRGLFVSLISATTARGVARLTLDVQLSSLNGAPYLGAAAIDAFGSGQPAGNQDAILSSMRLKIAGTTQPSGTSNGLLYHDVNSVTNPTFLYVNAFVIDTTKGQSVPTAAISKVAIPPLPPEVIAPVITGQPTNQTILESGTATLSVAAEGQNPLAYQWQYQSNNIPNATNAFYVITNVQVTASGSYRVVVTNSAGSVTSTNAILTVTPFVRSTAMSPLASFGNNGRLAVGSRSYLTTDNTQRGLAFNPANSNLVLLSRAPSLLVQVLNGTTGAEIRTLDTNGISGGTFPASLVGVADDGAVYAANLSLNGSTDPFKIYRWANDQAGTLPTVAYSGDPGAGVAHRWGDTLDVRGAGPATQILLGTQAGTNVAILTTTDGQTFTPKLIRVNGASANNFNLGIAWGAGNTFWGKSLGVQLVHVQFDLAAGTGTALSTALNPELTRVGAIGIDPLNDLIAGVSIENPDNLRLFQAGSGTNAPILIDQELFPSDNDNLNGTGAVDFGGGRIYALDSNNGILAMELGPRSAPRLNYARSGNNLTLSWTGSARLESAPEVTGPYTVVNGANSPVAVDLSSATMRYYRLVTP